MNIGSVEASFKIAGLEKSLKDLSTLHTRLNEVGHGLGNTFDESLKLIEGFKSLSKVSAAVLKNQTELAGANDAVVASGRRIVSQLEQEKIKLTQLISKEQELLALKQRVASFNQAPSNFKQFSQKSTPLGGQSTPYRTDLANPIMRSWQSYSAMSPIIDKATQALKGLTNQFYKASSGAKAFLTPSAKIQGVLAGWWEHFGRVGLGFGAVYAGLRAIGAAARYAFGIFTGGIKVMDDIRSSGAMVAGMLAMVTKNGKTFADNYSAYFANFTKVIGRVTTLLPQYGLTMEQFIAGTRELAQFGVVVDNDNLKESIISMKLIQEIAANTKQDTRQIRQELQAFFSGQARMSDQFARTVNNSMPELAKSIEKIRNEGGTTQQMWAKLSTEMFKMEPSIKAANANLEVQHEVLKASLSVISAMALEATGLYDIWLNGLQTFNDSLFNSKGRLTDFGKTLYKVFFKGWEWIKEWGQALWGVGQVAFAVLVKPFMTLFSILVDLKEGILDLADTTIRGFGEIWANLKAGEFGKAWESFGKMRDENGAKSQEVAAKMLKTTVDGLVSQGNIAIKGLENLGFGLGMAFTDNFVEATDSQQGNMNKALTGLLAPGGKPAEEAVEKWGAAWSAALRGIDFEKLDKIDHAINADIQTPYYDAIKAYNERMAEDFQLTFLKIRLEAASFGNYLGNSFKGLFSSVFAHEITTFAQFFQGAMKSIQQSFSEMLADMVSDYFTAMMRMQFQQGAPNILASLFGGGQIAGTSTGGIDPSNYSLSTLTSLPNNRSTTGNYSLMDNNFYTGGTINEPVWGVGKSGATYSFAEKGPERVLSNSESKDYGKSSAPSTTINFINESGVPLTATQSAPQFDGEKYVTSIIVKQMATNPSFRSSMRG